MLNTNQCLPKAREATTTGREKAVKISSDIKEWKKKH